MGTPNGTTEGASDSDEHSGLDANNTVSDGVDSSDVDMAGGMEPPQSRKGSVTNHVAPSPRVANHVAPPRRVPNHVAPSPRLANHVAPPPRVTNYVAPPPRERSTPLEAPPPMPQVFLARRQSVPNVPPFVGLPTPTPTPTPPKRETGRRSTGLLGDPSRRSSFLRYAGKDEGVAGAGEPSLTSTRVTGSRTPAALPAGMADEPAAAAPGERARRQSFLRRNGADGRVPAAKEVAAPAVVSPCKNMELDGGGGDRTGSSSRRGPRAGRVTVWGTTW